MATHRQAILDYLQSHPLGADDDQLAATLNIQPRQQVNTICRDLETEGLITRQVYPGSTKKVNRIHSTKVAPGLGSMAMNIAISFARNKAVQDFARKEMEELFKRITTSEEKTRGFQVKVPALLRRNKNRGADDAPTDPVHDRNAVPFTILTSDEAIKAFTYPGQCLLSEDSVKEVVGAFLRSQDYQVTVRLGHIHGIDIEAEQGDKRLVIEAKGEGTRPAMRVSYFLGALGELLQRMESPSAVYGLALPAHRQFAGLIMRFPQQVKIRLQLCFFLVRPTAGSYEVGYIPAPGNEVGS